MEATKPCQCTRTKDSTGPVLRLSRHQPRAWRRLHSSHSTGIRNLHLRPTMTSTSPALLRWTETRLATTLVVSAPVWSRSHTLLAEPTWVRIVLSNPTRITTNTLSSWAQPWNRWGQSKTLGPDSLETTCSTGSRETRGWVRLQTTSSSCLERITNID